MKASTTKVTERTQFKLLPEEDQEKDRAKRSRRIKAAETRQKYDGNSGEGPSGSTVIPQPRTIWTDQGSVGVPKASADGLKQSRERPLNWDEILNSVAP
jgi:hypothetical protein